jgi:alpha-L-arabinofuranosidase
VLKLVNPSDQAISLAVTVGGKFPVGTAAAKLELLAPDNLSARNSFESPNAVHVVGSNIPVSGNAGGRVAVSLPRWSVGVLELKAP